MSSERRIEPLEDPGAARILPLAQVTRFIGGWPPEFRALVEMALQGARYGPSPARGGGPAPAVFTIPEFCAAHRLSRSKLYQLWAAGAGPRKMSIGTKILITVEAAADWRREREATSAVETA